MQWNIKLPHLEYAVTKKYPWPHFNLVALITSIIVLTFLTFVNVQAVGYETVSVIDDYIPPAQGSWWSSLFRQSTPYCDPHQILEGDTFRTNMSTFSYVVNYINATANHLYSTKPSSLSGLEYAADLLATACDDQNEDRTLRIIVDGIRRMVIGTVEFKCTFATSAMVITASTTSYMGSSINPTGNDLGLGNKMSEILNRLAVDVVTSEIEQPGLASSYFFATSLCPDVRGIENRTPAALEECHDKPADVLLSWITGEGQPYPTVKTQTAARNYLIALSAASFADTGIWHKNSIYTSVDSLNATLDPTGGAHVQRIMTGDRYSPLTPAPAVISMTYTCHFRRPKSPLNFVISVLVADLTLFATFWAIFTSIASALARSRASPDLDTGSAASTPASTSETLPMIQRSRTKEYLDMQNVVLASASTCDTLPMAHRGSVEQLMTERDRR